MTRRGHGSVSLWALTAPNHHKTLRLVPDLGPASYRFSVLWTLPTPVQSMEFSIYSITLFLFCRIHPIYSLNLTQCGHGPVFFWTPTTQDQWEILINSIFILSDSPHIFSQLDPVWPRSSVFLDPNHTGPTRNFN